MPSILSLGEGRTPLVRSARIAPALWFKLEFCNPTGSFKDRFAAREVYRIAATGARLVLGTSSGNTGAALAAYCARAGVHCVLFASPEARAGKLAQMRAFGALVAFVPGFTTQADVTSHVLGLLEQASRNHGVPLVVSAYRYCPQGMHGVEEISGELIAAQPQHVFVPIGGGGLFVATVRGFRARSTRPRIHAVQPAGCPTVVEPWRQGRSAAIPVHSTTRISGLSVPNDIDATLALDHLRQSGGLGIAVSDEDILCAQHRLLREEGIFCEPAGAAAFAGWSKAAREGLIDPVDRAICLVTGHGAKDSASIAGAAATTPTVTLALDDVPPFLEERMRA